MTDTLKITIIVTGILIIGSVGKFFIQEKRNAINTIPHVYYSSMRVTNIDAAGNVSGKTSIFRVDGMKVKPVLVADLPGSQNEGVTFQTATLKYQVFSQSATNQIPSYFPVTIDGFGNEIQVIHPPANNRGNNKNQVLTQQQWIHPDGTYAARAEQYCTETPNEGPCMMSFRLTVTDLKTDGVRTYIPGDFHTPEGGFVPMVLVSISPETAIVSVVATQEMLTVFLGTINMSTGEVKPLLNLTETNNEVKGYDFLQLSNDKLSAVFLARDSGVHSQIISINMTDGSVKNISGPINSAVVRLSKDASNILYESADGASVISRDIKSGKEKTIARTSLSHYLHPLRFTVEWKTSSGGVSSGKLVVTDQKTHRQRVIYDQLQESNAFQYVNQGIARPAKIGNLIYSFIGIDQ